MRFEKKIFKNLILDAIVNVCFFLSKLGKKWFELYFITWVAWSQFHQLLRAHFAPIFLCQKLHSCVLGLTFFCAKILGQNVDEIYTWIAALCWIFLTFDGTPKKLSIISCKDASK